jgi:predicted AAA+ superfamily ATPase
LNASSIANDAGITHTTVRRWISVLEASFVVMLLRPHHRNFGKRLIRSPKLYFLDTGLLCSLLEIRTPADLAIHGSRGAIFESFVLAEMVKALTHRGQPLSVYFWRDSAGHEVDFLVEVGERLLAFEAKSGETIPGSFFEGLRWWRDLGGDATAPATLVHGGRDSFLHQGIVARSWQTL